MEKISKKRKEVLNKTNVDKIYALDEAIDIVKENAKSKFNETLDIAVNLSLNSGKSENNIKGIISLPNGIGKKLKVAVIVESEKSSEAKVYKYFPEDSSKPFCLASSQQFGYMLGAVSTNKLS